MTFAKRTLKEAVRKWRQLRAKMKGTTYKKEWWTKMIGIKHWLVKQ